jgi:hypothetical protein
MSRARVDDNDGRLKGVDRDIVGGTMRTSAASIARQAGLNRLVAEVLASNGAMLKVLEGSGLQMSRRRECTVVRVTLTYA